MNLARLLSLRTALALVGGALLLSGCASADAPGATAGEATTLPPTDMVEPSEAASPASQFTGTVGGDAQLEGGCLWLETDEGRFELRLPDDFAVDTQELTITAPDGTAVSAGDTVEVAGTVLEDMVSVCQVGPILEVSQLTAAATEPQNDY